MIHKIVEINNNEVTALFDTASVISLMRVEFYVRIGAPGLIKQSIKFGVSATENFTLGQAHVRVNIDDESFEVDFYVVPDVIM